MTLGHPWNVRVYGGQLRTGSGRDQLCYLSQGWDGVKGFVSGTKGKPELKGMEGRSRNEARSAKSAEFVTREKLALRIN